ncbi:MAG: hypothetical protein RR602_11095 [Longicatena sp.]
MKGKLIKAMQRNQLIDIMYMAKDGTISKRRIKVVKKGGDKLQAVEYYLDEITTRIDTIDIDIAYNITLSDKYEYYMSCQRHKFTKQD